MVLVAKSTTMLTQPRRKPGPKPTGKGTLVGVRLQADLLNKVDALAKTDGISRPEAIRRLIERA